MDVETCANCGCEIGNLETPMAWKEAVVCGPCHSKLAGPVLDLASKKPRRNYGLRIAAWSLAAILAITCAFVIWHVVQQQIYSREVAEKEKRRESQAAMVAEEQLKLQKFLDHRASEERQINLRFETDVIGLGEPARGRLKIAQRAFNRYQKVDSDYIQSSLLEGVPVDALIKEIKDKTKQNYNTAMGY